MILMRGMKKSFLLEGASIDNLDPSASEEVKDTIETLEKDLTNNVDNVDAPEVSNGEIQDSGVGLSVESCTLYKVPGKKKYFVNMNDILRIQEGAAEDEAREEAESNGDDPDKAAAEADPSECKTDASDIVEKIADANGVDKEDVTVVIQTKEAAYISQAALYESACTSRPGRAIKRMKALKEAVSCLWFHDIKMIRK